MFAFFISFEIIAFLVGILASFAAELHITSGLRVPTRFAGVSFQSGSWLCTM